MRWKVFVEEVLQLLYAITIWRMPSKLRNSVLWISQQKLIALGVEKTNFRLTIYSHSSTSPENLEKIGPIDFEINGLTRIVKTFLK